MGWTSAILFGALVVVAGAYALYLYGRRELGVPGVGPLAILRTVVLATVLLLLLNPTLPDTATGLGAGASWLLLDGSRSMAAPAGAGSPWTRVVREARAEGGPALVFGGDDPRPLEVVDTADRPPFGSSSLVPALERAAESGARRVRVVSDLRLDDAARVGRVAERLGLDVAVEDVGGDVRSVGVASLRFEGPLEPDEPVPVEVEVFAVGVTAGDSVTVEVREEGRVVASTRVPVPDEGRLLPVELELPAPSAEGEVRYTARALLEGDGFAADDERVAWADVDPQAGNLVLVSLEPDWELRFLLPVFQRVTGLPARGFVRVGADRFLSMDPEGAGGTVDRATVEGLAAGAEVLVVQAASSPPPWLEPPLNTVRRVVMLARGPGAAAAAGVAAGAPRPGEWYASPEIPPSPLAGELAGAELAGLPPLAEVLPLASDEPPGVVALDLQLRGSGIGEVGLILVPAGERGRRVVALASGFWRWAFREGTARDAYERLWSGVAGWLLADEPLTRGPGVRPEERLVPWREPVWWTASGLAGTDVRIRLALADTAVRAVARDTVAPDSLAVAGAGLDTVVTVPEAGRFRLPALEPGTWAWRAEPAADSSVSGSWRGRLEVEDWTADLRHPRDTLLARGGGGSEVGSAGGPGRPLRTHPLPYLLILALLSAEWIGRRRKGLR